MTDTEPKNDGYLLATFVVTGSESAFAALVERHGAMVHGVCLRILGDHHEAEDVTQAVFLTLARKASTLRRDVSAGGWLHTVAWRLAFNARQSRISRQQREEVAMLRVDDPVVTAVDPAGLQLELDVAIGRLPDRYRRPLVLFHLEGHSLQQTATQLGLNLNTTGTRLARARELLRKKLVRQGVSVASVGALTTLLSAEAGAAALPATFVSATVKAAGLAAAGKLAVGVSAGTVSAHVAALTKGAVHMLFWNSVKTVAVTAVCISAIGTGIVVAQWAAGDPTARPAAKTKVLDINNTSGKLVKVAADGAVTLDVYVPFGNGPASRDTRMTIPAADGYAGRVRESAAKFKAGNSVKVFQFRAADGKLRALAVGLDPMPADLRALELTGFGSSPQAVTGDPGKIFKAIDTTKPGTYGDGKWGYSYAITSDGPQKGYRQGFLKYDARDLLNPQPGDYIFTPWGWMQWQERVPAAGNWLPVAEKPATGKQLPDPATHP